MSNLVLFSLFRTQSTSPVAAYPADPASLWGGKNACVSC